MISTATHKYLFSAADQREWFFDLQRDPLEKQDQSENPDDADILATLKARLIKRMSEGDDQQLIVTGDQWTAYEGHALPTDEPDYGLLYQDPAPTQALVDALGPGYAHCVTKPGSESFAALDTSGRQEPLR